ncbi:PREDICTED: uncharacterized protein LOC105556385 [Vollenhovia emeryi]|uniref:uncharacterized protein LOC105556385 n=1 Tax=Vollenhovia emeryi TaxID=411798 RepID=UPI0005F4EB44|nr:PREDICTED: uncharacterized protein LOC105556385 [Vollenhovia emeryi]
MVDRFSRWPEAVPLHDVTASSVAKAFYNNWVSRFGSPQVITTDQGAQFESQIFKSLLSFIGFQRIRTTAYHPAANGMVERWHRSLKTALMCHSDTPWTRSLSTVLLGLRTHLRSDTGASPADFLYGTSLRIPGEFLSSPDFKPNPQIFLEDFREYMRSVKPVPVTHNYKSKAFFFKDLTSCTHVFMLVKTKKSLEQPYSGPHKILERNSDRVFTIDINGSPRSVSVEHLKPAYFVPDNLAPCEPTQASDSLPSTSLKRPVTFSDKIMGKTVTLPSQTQEIRPVLKTYSRRK